MEDVGWMMDGSSCHRSSFIVHRSSYGIDSLMNENAEENVFARLVALASTLRTNEGFSPP